MTTDSSRNTAESDSHLALARLLEGLRHRGMVIGPDDAARVAAVFRHAGKWPHARRVHALRALLARTDEERALIDQLAPLLFQRVNGERGARAGEGVLASEGLGLARGEANRAHTSDASSSTDSSEERDRKRRNRRRTWIAIAMVAAFVTPVAVLVISAYRAPDRKPEPVSGLLIRADAGVEAVMDAGVDTGANAGVDKESDAGTQVPPPPPPTLAACDTKPPPVLPRWPFALGMVLLSLPMAWYLRRRQVFLRQERNILAVAESTGPRTWILDATRTERARPLDATVMREAAFHLSAPTVDASAPWIDVAATVEATVHAAGRLDLHWARWREHNPVLLIQDIGSSMARWPLHGQQLAEALERNGSQVVHQYMDRTPDTLAADPELTMRQPLERVLAGVREPAIVILSDAAALDRADHRRDPQWLGPLRHATWLHPAPPELWGEGARWLAEQIRVVPMSPEGLMRLGTPRMGDGEDLPARWQPPHLLGPDPRAIVQALHAVLGPHAWRWLAAGAVLDQAGALTTRNWWQLHADGVVTPHVDGSTEISWQCAERVWTAANASVTPDGSVLLPDPLSRALVAELMHRDPALLTAVVEWAEKSVRADLSRLQELDPRSPAVLDVRTTLARLLILDPARRTEGKRAARKLAKEGYGTWLRTTAGNTGQGPWRFRIPRVARPMTYAWYSAMASIFGAMVFAFVLFVPGVRESLRPRGPEFYLVGGEPYIVRTDAPLTVCKRYDVGGDDIFVAIDGREFSLASQSSSGQAPVWLLTAEALVGAHVKADAPDVQVSIGREAGSSDGTWRVSYEAEGTVDLRGEVDLSGEVPVILLHWDVTTSVPDESLPARWTVFRDDEAVASTAETEWQDRETQQGSHTYRVRATSDSSREFASNTYNVDDNDLKATGILVLVATDEQEATVTVDGHKYERIVGELPMELRHGSYVIHIERSGCSDKEATISVAAREAIRFEIPKLNCGPNEVATRPMEPDTLMAGWNLNKSSEWISLGTIGGGDGVRLSSKRMVAQAWSARDCIQIEVEEKEGVSIASCRVPVDLGERLCHGITEEDWEHCRASVLPREHESLMAMQLGLERWGNWIVEGPGTPSRRFYIRAKMEGMTPVYPGLTTPALTLQCEWRWVGEGPGVRGSGSTSLYGLRPEATKTDNRYLSDDLMNSCGPEAE